MTGAFARGSLRRKLTMGTVVVIIAAQLIAAIVLIVIERGRARVSLADSLQTSAHIVVDNVAAALMFEYRDEAAETLRALGVQRGFQHACLYDQHAQLFAAHLVVGTCDPAPGPDGAEFGRVLTVNTPIVQPASGRIGTLSLQSSLEPIDERVRVQIVGTLLVPAPAHRAAAGARVDGGGGLARSQL
jgi:hypothetical protein